MSALTSAAESPTRCVDIDASVAFDAISYEPFEHDQVAFILNNSDTTPVSEATLRRLYLDSGPYDLNPFTNEQLTGVSAVRVSIRGEAVLPDKGQEQR